MPDRAQAPFEGHNQWASVPRESALSKSVFISHAVKDSKLAEEIVDLLEEGMGVPGAEIFCSSLTGYGIPTGQNFVTYIKNQLADPKVVILILTPSYFESKFCLAEMGAAWIMSHEQFPILVPPLGYDSVKDVLLGVQVAKVDDDIKYNELLNLLEKEVTLIPKTRAKWDTKRRSFLKAIKPILEEVQGPTLVPAEDYEAMRKRLEEAQAEMDIYEQTVRSLKERISATEALKDKAAVASLYKSTDGVSVLSEFDILTDEIADYRSKLRGAEVFVMALSSHYGKPYKIDWFHQGDDFRDAAQYGFITEDDAPNWSNKTMKNLAKKLDELSVFMDENDKELRKAQEDDVPMEREDKDFWDYHYKL